MNDSVIYDASAIRAILPSGADAVCIKETESTNTIAREYISSGAASGTVILADTQTAGRGRRGNTFYSPEGGIYMSVILKPDRIPLLKSDIITARVGACVCESIENLTGIIPDIRGINDLYIGDRKVCGILIESGSEFDSGTLQWIVAGIGVNFDSDIKRFPSELRNKATSLFEPGKAAISKNCLIAKILQSICNL
jgi:BirA family biotin operon repressor/biotin-[acetyl-CoA-carboxylase] ligase